MRTTYTKDNFDLEAFSRSEYGMNASHMQYFYMRFKDAPMHSVVTDYWSSCGVKKEVFSFSAETDRVYAVFTPADMNTEKKYPLLYCFYDRADDYFKAETYGYTELSASEGFICVYPQYDIAGLPGLHQEFMDVLEALKEKRYPVDEERIYAAGFFYGASAAVKLALTSPGVFAGLGLFCGSHIFRGRYLPARLEEYVQTETAMLPMICAGGGSDAKNIWPLEQDSFTDVFNRWMTDAAHIDDYRPINSAEARELAMDPADPVKREFGLHFDRTRIEEREGTEWYIGDYLNSEGIPAARFVSGCNIPHIHCRSISYYIWDYLKKFRRNGIYLSP